MAVYKIFPEKDATIYSGYPLRNTGLDEILEASTFYDTTSPEVSRYLIKFSQDEINDIIQNKIGNSSYQTNLRNYTANITGLNQTTTLDIHPISGSWAMGTGRYSNSPQVTNGVSWKYQASSGSGEWPTSFTAYVTASYMSTNIGGGVWYTGSALGLEITASQTLSYPNNNDLNVNVTNIIQNWYSASQNLGGFNNDGFIVKQSNLSEFVADQNYVTTVKYFSIDTHTIYPPCLEFKWRDYSFNTGSSANSIINTSRLVATLGDNSGYYRLGSVEKFRINCRPQFPTRTFQTSSIYTTNYYLPTSSYYAIKDLDTNEFVIDFDTDYTQISADNESSYFTLYMNGLEPERYYQVLLKVIIGNETLILDDNYYFKIING
jgi:hypothetical protein